MGFLLALSFGFVLLVLLYDLRHKRRRDWEWEEHSRLYGLNYHRSTLAEDELFRSIESYLRENRREPQAWQAEESEGGLPHV
jgi:hypothetical protein